MLYKDYNSRISFGYVLRMNHMRFSRFTFMTINKHISNLCFVVLCIKSYYVPKIKQFFESKVEKINASSKFISSA